MTRITPTNRGLDLTIPVGFLAFIGLGMFDGVLGVAWPSMRITFEVNLEALGILLLALTAGASITSFLAGQAITRFPLVVVLSIGTGLRVLSMFAASVIGSWFLLIVSIFFFGVSAGLIDTVINIYFAQNHRPRILNWLHASFGIGATTGPLLMTTLFSAGLSWRWGMVTIAVFHLILILLFFLTRERWQYDDDQHIESEDRPKVRMSETLRLPVVWLSILLFFLYSGLEVTAGQWSYTLFTEGRSIDVILAGQIVSLYWATFTIGRIIIGLIADKINGYLILRTSFLSAVLGAALIWWNPAPVWSFAGLALLGLSFAAVFPTLIATTPDRLGKDHATHAIGFQIGAAGIGIGLLPWVAGLLTVRSGLEVIGPFLASAALLMFLVFEILRVAGPPDIIQP